MRLDHTSGLTIFQRDLQNGFIGGTSGLSLGQMQKISISRVCGGRTDILHSPFFDVQFSEEDVTVEDYIDRVLCQLTLAIEEHLPTGHWMIVNHPINPPSPTTSTKNRALKNLFRANYNVMSDRSITDTSNHLTHDKIAFILGVQKQKTRLLMERSSFGVPCHTRPSRTQNSCGGSGQALFLAPHAKTLLATPNWAWLVQETCQCGEAAPKGA
ncbi:hypothetical protein M5K25_023860 [Dendrobium thyrsiflorum]|uniref:Uncharacterized protein n=1 Tax=Dendrobium thyrsiflorum TaxID=117978 RepID=A0ABD0U0S9_DENTH